jgi:hypothetical protein
MNVVDLSDPRNEYGPAVHPVPGLRVRRRHPDDARDDPGKPALLGQDPASDNTSCFISYTHTESIVQVTVLAPLIHTINERNRTFLTRLVLASLNVRKCEYLLASGFETFGVLKQLDEVS